MTTVTRQIQFKTKARRKTIVPNASSTQDPKRPVARIPRVSKLMALAIRFDQLFNEGSVADQSELSRLLHITQPRMTQIMNLLHLAPDIQEEVLHLPLVASGPDPITERDLRPIARLMVWHKQRTVWCCRVICYNLRNTDNKRIDFRTSPLSQGTTYGIFARQNHDN